METKFGNIDGVGHDKCKPTELYYRASDIDALRNACFNCDKSHTRKVYELERTIESLKKYKCAYYIMFAAALVILVILVIAYILK